MIPAGATHIRVTDNSRNYLGKTHTHTHTHTHTPHTHTTDTLWWLQCKSGALDESLSLCVTPSPRSPEAFGSSVRNLRAVFRHEVVDSPA